jgi:cysteine-rich secretory family protein
MTAQLVLRNAHRLVAFGLATLGFWALVSGAQATSDLTPGQAEAQAIRLLNQQRVAVGAVALRLDWRLTAIARSRSTDMARKGYFDHRQPDGRYAWDLMNAASIAWYEAGENIAWNNWTALRDSATGAATQWRNSAPHYAITINRNFNYFGVGVAIDAATGKKFWTAVFMKGPDRTGAVARLSAPTVTGSGAIRSVSLAWRGSDVRLSVLTSGLYTFQLQRRVDGGAWQTLSSATTTTSRRVSAVRGHLYEYRVRARDRAGNYGLWTAPIAVRA